MKNVTVEDVRAFLVSFISQKLESQGRHLESDIPDDYDLLLESIIDSLGILEMITKVEEHFGLQIDFEELDSEDITVVGPFCRYVEQKSKV